MDPLMDPLMQSLSTDRKFTFSAPALSVQKYKPVCTNVATHSLFPARTRNLFSRPKGKRKCFFCLLSLVMLFYRCCVLGCLWRKPQNSLLILAQFMTGCYIFFGCHLVLGIVDISENMVICFLMGAFSWRAKCELSDSQLGQTLSRGTISGLTKHLK